METLILSCSTGGGHNSAGKALAEEFIRRGHNVSMLDPYALAGRPVEYAVSGVYVDIAQKVPSLFGKIYELGDKVRNIPGKSPVYYANLLMGDRLADYLAEHPADVIVMTHVFPAEIVAGMKRRGIRTPLTVFVSTDYVCIPFVEESECDYYVTPSPLLADPYIQRGIPEEKLLNFGIPVKSAFGRPLSKQKAAERLGLSPDRKYLLLSGGSMGAGDIPTDILLLDGWLRFHPDYRLIVICGNNDALFERLRRDFCRNPRIIFKRRVERMYDMLHLCEVHLSKPGGLSSTEAAVAEIPLIHISPIPGCESYNLDFFSRQGLSIAVGNHRDKLIPALESVLNPEIANQMREKQRRLIAKDSAARICDFCEEQVRANGA